jgi:hypothetical protein
MTELVWRRVTADDRQESKSVAQNIIGTTEPGQPPVAHPAPTIVEETVRRLLQAGGMVSVAMIVRELRLRTGCSRAGAYRAVADAFATGTITRT